MLALMHAKDCAKVGLKTLFLCYNRPLADFLRRERESLEAVGEDVEALRIDTFDRFARWWLDEVEHTTGKDFVEMARNDLPSADEHEVILPVALEDALSKHPLAIPYDVVIIDEGQDFGDDHWAALNKGLLDRAGHRCAVFFDSNQAIYRQAKAFPVPAGEILELTRNCRNTVPIHEAAYSFYTGPPEVEASSISGKNVARWHANGLRKQANLMVSHISDWVERGRVQPEQVAILLMRNEPVPAEAMGNVKWGSLPEAVRNRLGPAWCSALRALEKRGLKASVKSYWKPGRVLIDWVGRYKGLEADIIVLWVNGVPEPHTLNGLRYVGCSRAKSVLALVGEEAGLATLFPLELTV